MSEFLCLFPPCCFSPSVVSNSNLLQTRCPLLLDSSLCSLHFSVSSVPSVFCQLLSSSFLPSTNLSPLIASCLSPLLFHFHACRLFLSHLHLDLCPPAESESRCCVAGSFLPELFLFTFPPPACFRPVSWLHLVFLSPYPYSLLLLLSIALLQVIWCFCHHFVSVQHLRVGLRGFQDPKPMLKLLFFPSIGLLLVC